MHALLTYLRQNQYLNYIFLFALACIACCITTSVLAAIPLQCSLDTVPESTVNINRKDTSVGYDTPPSYPGGMNGWIRYIAQNTKFPPGAIDGQVAVTFTVDEKGRLSNFTAVSEQGKLKREAIRLVRNSGRWNPATANGSPVTAEKVLKITFHQEY